MGLFDFIKNTVNNRDSGIFDEFSITETTVEEDEEKYDEFANSPHICPKCGGIMQFDYKDGEDTWICYNCGTRGVSEYDVIKQEWYVSTENSYLYDDVYHNSINEEPECCKACGGPWPACETSCKIFDD